MYAVTCTFCEKICNLKCCCHEFWVMQYDSNTVVYWLCVGVMECECEWVCAGSEMIVTERQTYCCKYDII